MRVRYTPRARRDVRAILHYLEERNPQGALNVKQTIRKTIDLIGNHPRSGRFAGIEGTRVLPAGRYPYLVYWTIEAGEVWIVHVRHMSRRPWAGGE